MEYWCLEYKFRLLLDMTLILKKKKGKALTGLSYEA